MEWGRRCAGSLAPALGEAGAGLDFTGAPRKWRSTPSSSAASAPAVSVVLMSMRWAVVSRLL